MKRRYLAVYERGMSGYLGHIPDLPGVVSTAETLEEMQRCVRNAVEVHLALLATEAKGIPNQTTTVVEFPRPVEGAEDKHWVVERLEIKKSNDGVDAAKGIAGTKPWQT